MARGEQASIVEFTMIPGSATPIDGRVRVRTWAPSREDEHLFFNKEDGQWKLDL